MTSSRSPEFDARQFTLPNPIHTLSPQVSSFLYDPISTSLALRHFDSSFSLYPSFSPLSLPSFPSLKSLVPSPTSSATFLHLRTSSNSTTTIFVTTSPLLGSTPSTILRFYVLRGGDRFGKIKVISNHRDLEFDQIKSGVVFKVNHGASMRLSGGINVFSLYSVSNCKIWVFAVRMVQDDVGGEDALKLMKCAVIDCCLPLFTIRILFGFLVLGEENGIRIFPLQQLVKGNQKKEKKNTGRRFNLRNGLINGIDVAKGSIGDLNLLPAKAEKHSDSVKSRSVKLKQDSIDMGIFFVAFKDKDKDKDGESSMSTKLTRKSVKAISIQGLSANYLVVLDSGGDVHLLSLPYSSQGLANPCIMKRLDQTMKVVQLAVFHDVSTVTKTIWMSDGCHTVHLMMVSDVDTDEKETKEMLLQTSVTHGIFTGEKIQDVVPLASNAVLILGQGSVYAYAIPSLA